ncbi:hypothetical protein [Thalassospira xiamenensis]|uniref:hypothetical protein n=1 Tax=Thalassospira xiamenensis TaxID=220697 RepID=UPI000DEDB1DB|nr:hypothetical protein [Thalassospira xiamenensis]RCK32235.1 hypothetical protein TH24_22415 [Thalassospira xiamenensis]
MKLARLGFASFVVTAAIFFANLQPAYADNEDANEAYVKLGQLYRATVITPSYAAKVNAFSEVLTGLEKLISDYPESDVAVRIISEQNLFGGLTLSEHLDNEKYRTKVVNRDTPEAAFLYYLGKQFQNARGESTLNENTWNLILKDAPPVEEVNDPDLYWRHQDVIRCYQHGYVTDDALRALAFIESQGGHLRDWIDGFDPGDTSHKFREILTNTLKYSCPSRVSGNYE